MNTTLAPDFRVVREHVARNPVARAIARRNLTEAVRDFSIRLHLLHDGELVAADAQASARVLAIAIHVCDYTLGADSVNSRVMCAGMRCLEQLAARGFKWRMLDAVAIEQALRYAVDVYNAASAEQVNAAWRHVRRLETAAGMPA